ncbi:MAG: FAD-dependent oxidoreductase [Planctomycetota bacterium]|nr:FAD-dependent oxidoreductase [Planctomycetota bacterium]
MQHLVDARTKAWTERIGGRTKGFHPEAKKLALEELCAETGVRIFARCFFLGVLLEGRAVRGIAIDGAFGPGRLEAQVVIDSTGDGDVCAAAGAPFRAGRDADGLAQPFSLVPGQLQHADALSFRNFDAGYADPTHARDVSRAQFVGRALLRKDAFDAESRMLYVAPVLGVRESRHVATEYVVTLDDQRALRSFPDAIARAKAHYDNHAFDYENESLDAAAWLAAAGIRQQPMCVDIPYRALVPLGAENLLVACRAAGFTHDAMCMCRMQRDMQALGEAAAVAAAVALRGRTSVRAADVRAIQRRLVEREALPPDVLDGRGAGSSLEPDLERRDASVAELLLTWGTRNEPAAQKELFRRGAAAHPGLREALRGAEAGPREMAAVALALQGLDDGAELLKAMLRERRQDVAGQTMKTPPRWMGALLLLDKLGPRKLGALELVLGLLNDEPFDTRKALPAVRVLARHATAEEALEPLRETLRRVRATAELPAPKACHPLLAESLYDRRYELELAVAEALAGFGRPGEAREIARPYLDDGRAPVRSYARRVAEAAVSLVEAESVKQNRYSNQKNQEPNKFQEANSKLQTK